MANSWQNVLALDGLAIDLAGPTLVISGSNTIILGKEALVLMG